MRFIGSRVSGGVALGMLPFISSACSLVLPFGDYSEGSGAATSSGLAGASSGASGGAGGCTNACAPQVLAKDQGNPSDIAAGNGKVAWITSQALYAMPQSAAPGDVPQALEHEGPVSDLEFDGDAFVAVEKSPRALYVVQNVDVPANEWTEIGYAGDPMAPVAAGVGVVAVGLFDGGVRACSPNTTCDTFVGNWEEPAGVGDVLGAEALAPSAAHVFGAESSTGILKRCQRPSGPCVDFAVEQAGVAHVALAGSHVVWAEADRGAVMYCPAAGCDPTPIELATPGSGAGITALTLAPDGTVYWVENATGSVMRCKVAGCPEGPSVVAENLASPTMMALDGDALFVVESGTQSILKIGLAP
jgi:hypothetical protein